MNADTKKGNDGLDGIRKAILLSRKFSLFTITGHEICVARNQVHIEPYEIAPGLFVVRRLGDLDKLKNTFVVDNLRGQLYNGPGNNGKISYEEACVWVEQPNARITGPKAPVY